MLDCPNCGAQAKRLIIFNDPYHTGCDNCGQARKRFSITGLGSTDDKWHGDDGKVHRITAGKRWEIENRTISKDDGKTVINKVTGKPTQY